MKEYEKEIVIKIIWDDDNANIAHRPSDNKMRVKISGGNFKRMDPLFKLDFFTDMKEWVQSMVDEIHAKELDENDRFTHTYVMRCPQSTTQWRAEQEDPTLEKRIVEKVKQTRRAVDRKMALARRGMSIIK